jgi:hypothetical protein
LSFHRLQTGARAPPPEHLYAAFLRVALLPWNEPPHAIASSLDSRLKHVEIISKQLGVSGTVHRKVRNNDSDLSSQGLHLESLIMSLSQAVIRALMSNDMLKWEVDLFKKAVQQGTVPGVGNDDPTLSKVGTKQIEGTFGSAIFQIVSKYISFWWVNLIWNIVGSICRLANLINKRK